MPKVLWCLLSYFSDHDRVVSTDIYTTVRKFELFGCVTTLARFGRRPELSPSDERKLLGTTKARACHELETAGTAAVPMDSEGTKQEKKSLLQNWCSQGQLKFAAHKQHAFWRKIYGQLRQSLMYLATMPRHMFGGVNEKPLSLCLSYIYPHTQDLISYTYKIKWLPNFKII